MRKNTCLCFLFVLFSIMLLLASGCGGKETADVTIKKMCQTLLRQDVASLGDMGFSSGQANTAIFDYMLSESLKQNQNQHTLSEQQIRRLCVGLVDAIKQCKVQTKLLSSDRTTAKVKVTVGNIHLDDFSAEWDNNAELRREAERRLSNISDRNQATEELVNLLAEYMQTMKPEGTRSFTVDCVYNRKTQKWMPKDFGEFVKDLATSTLQSDSAR